MLFQFNISKYCKGKSENKLHKFSYNVPKIMLLSKMISKPYKKSIRDKDSKVNIFKFHKVKKLYN